MSTGQKDLTDTAIAGIALVDGQIFQFEAHLEQSGHLPVLCPLVFLLDLGLRVRSNVRAIRPDQLRIQTSSSGVKSFTMLKSFLISSGDFPLIIFATVLHPTSL